jgi:N-acetylglucosamine-6-sulfatase
MEGKLYEMMEELGGMDIPLNAPRGRSQNKRLRPRKGDSANDFPSDMVLDEPVNNNAN